MVRASCSSYLSEIERKDSFTSSAGRDKMAHHRLEAQGRVLKVDPEEVDAPAHRLGDGRIRERDGTAQAKMLRFDLAT